VANSGTDETYIPRENERCTPPAEETIDRNTRAAATSDLKADGSASRSPTATAITRDTLPAVIHAPQPITVTQSRLEDAHYAKTPFSERHL